MSLIRGKDTKPEMVVRRLIHALGYRYRLHARSLPGRPDLVFSSRRAVIFVHGCFWHRHACPLGNRTPKSRVAFWTAKLDANRERDRRTLRALRRQGWRVLTVWECELRSLDRLRRKVVRFLDDERPKATRASVTRSGR